MQLSKDLGWLRSQRLGNCQHIGQQGKQKRVMRDEPKGGIVHSRTGRLQKQGNPEQDDNYAEPDTPEVKPAVAPEDSATFPEV